METETAERIRENGTMAEMATRHRMKISVSRDELVASVISRPSRRAAPCRFSPGSSCAPTAALDPGRHGHGVVAADDARRPGRGRGVVIPGKPLVELAPAPRATSRSSTGPRRGTVQIVSGSYSSRLHVFNAEDFPRLPRSTRSCTRSTARRCSRPSTGSPLGLADESRPVLTGILVPSRPASS